jgi:hypothetical protein
MGESIDLKLTHAVYLYLDTTGPVPNLTGSFMATTAGKNSMVLEMFLSKLHFDAAYAVSQRIPHTSEENIPVRCVPGFEETAPI